MDAERIPSRYVVASDGMPALQGGLWTLDKHHYLRRYMDVFTTGMKAKWSSRIYIDLFSGAGLCRLEATDQEVQGSPLLALDTRYGFTTLFFNDVEQVAIDALRQRVGSLPDKKIVYSAEDCNVAAQRIGAWLDSASLCLAFIDPFGWEIKFSSIAALVRRARVDLVITFHSGSIKRAADYGPEVLHEFFGSSGWKVTYDESRRSGQREATRVILDSYEKNLKRLGYRFIRDHVLVRNSQGTPLYHLAFASRHPRGEEFWNKVTARDARGQQRLL